MRYPHVKKKVGSTAYKVAGIIGWPVKKAARALVWAGAKALDAAIHAVSEKAAAARKPRKPAAYSGFVTLGTVSGNLGQFEEYILNSKSSVGIILGARGTGKSALGMRILENVHAKTKRKVAAMGFQNESLPRWIKVVERTDEIENGSFVLVDEGGIVFSARKAMSDANKILSELLLISRHKDLSILFISQNSANLDVNAIRQADYLLLRKSSLLQKDFERKKIKEVYEAARGLFEKHLDERQKVTYIYSDDFEGMVSNVLPSFWSEEASKAFRNQKPK